jgi:hypothetical protein
MGDSLSLILVLPNSLVVGCPVLDDPRRMPMRFRYARARKYGVGMPAFHSSHMLPQLLNLLTRLAALKHSVSDFFFLQSFNNHHGR